MTTVEKKAGAGTQVFSLYIKKVCFINAKM